MDPREQYKKAKKEFDTLRAKKDRTAEDETRLDALMDEMTELEPALDRLAKLDRTSQAAENYARQSAGRVSGREEFSEEEDGEGGSEGEGGSGSARTREMLSARQAPVRLGKRVTDSDKFKTFSETGTPQRIAIGSFYHRDPEQSVQPFGRYAILDTTAIEAVPDRRPGIAMAEMPTPTVRDAFVNTPTTSSSIDFLREDVANNDNAADFFDPDEDWANPPTDTIVNVKPESTLAFEEDSAPVRTIATTLPVVDQLLDDIPGLQGTIEGRLLDFLRETEEDALLNGPGTGVTIRGLLQHTGVQDANDAYFAGLTPLLPDTGEYNEDINRLTHAMRMVRENGFATPSFLMLSPAALDFLLMATDANRQYLAGNPFSTTGIPRFRGLPIIVTTALADDHAVVGDGRLAEVRDRMAARVDIGYVDKQFAQNRRTLRAEERLALAVIRPAGFVDVELTLTGGA